MAGDRLVAGDLGGTLEAVAADGPDAVLSRRHCRGNRSPRTGQRRRHHPPRPRVVPRDSSPARRGCLPRSRVRVEPAALIRRSADRLRARAARPAGHRPEPGSAPELASHIEVLREQARARDARFTRELYRGGLARRLLTEGSLAAGARRLRNALRAPAERASPGGTTHISAVDAAGNAAALSSSTGAGSGVVVPGTGIHMNNMLGEYDLQPAAGSCARHPTDEHDVALDRVESRRAAARPGQCRARCEFGRRSCRSW